MDYYLGAEATEPKGTVGIDDLIGAIRGSDFKDKVEHVRTLVVTGDADAISAAKKKLNAISVSGCIVEGKSMRRAKAVQEGRFQHNGLIQIDIDGKDNPGIDLDAVRRMLIEDPRIVAVFRSPSGTGMKGIARIDPTAHRASFAAVEQHFANLGIVIDKACKDEVRLCFVSYDPDAYIDLTKTDRFEPMAGREILENHARKTPAPKIAETTASAPRINGKAAPVLTDKMSAEMTPAAVQSMLACIPPRPPYAEWLKISSAVFAALGKDAGTAALRAWSPEEDDDEYAIKYERRLTEITAGSLVFIAQQHGWQGTSSAIRANTARIREVVAPAAFPDLTRFGESDADNALRVHAVAGENFHFVADSGQWLVWSGCRWVPDKDGMMVRLFLNVMDGAARQGLEKGKGGESLVKFSMRCRDRAKVAAGLEMLKSVEGVSISASQLDADPWLLGTPNGMIDLRTGHPMAPNKRALVTKSIACNLDHAAECPIWETVIHRATAGNVELSRFLQCAIGYSLTGSVREECMMFLYGTGANSKGTVVETVKTLLCDYAITAPESLFTIDRNSSATNDIARLAGCRFACAAELDENTAFAESRLKSITSKDSITARFLHHEFFDFRPTHKLWISGNHKPTIRGTDEGIWRRMRLVPFTVTIPKEERDLNLAEKLRDELPGILRWAMEGCLLWQRERLHTPMCVTQATADYRASEDVMGQFLEDCTVATPDERTLQSSFFEAYQGWAEKQGVKRPLTATSFNRKLEERGFERIKVKGGRYWRGISLL